MRAARSSDLPQRITTSAAAVIAVVHHDHVLALTALSLCGAFGSFLIYNFSPASIYLGDAGSRRFSIALDCPFARWWW